MKEDLLREAISKEYGEVVPQKETFATHLKQIAKFFSLKILVSLFPYVSKEDLVRLIVLYARLFGGNSADYLEELRDYLQNSHFGEITHRISRLAHPKALQAIALNLLVEGLIVREQKRIQEELRGGAVPYALLLSPTARCNLKCSGCFAANYPIKDELPFELFDRVLTEAEDMGVAVMTILGGEPFLYPHLYDLLAHHPKSFFFIFTNGTLIDEAAVRKLKELANMLLILSLEGFKEQTDRRRGPGTFDKVMEVMSLLRREKVPFGYSVTVTRENEPVVASQSFIDLMIHKGALMGWMFLCMPVGRNPDPDLLPTPEQRAHMLEFVNWVRDTRPIFMIDFWNDAPYVGGCIAGKYYAHITSKGYVEPCIFTHFAQDNIKEKSLREAMNSPFFRELRRRQPFNVNLYLPCMWIDNPEVSRELYSGLNLCPTHPGATDILEDPAVRAKIDTYSQRLKEVYRPLWERDSYNLEGFLKIKKSVMDLFCH